MQLKEIYILKTAATQRTDNTVTKKGVRIGVLTSRLFRVEFDRGDAFLDEATQTVLKRDLGEAKFSVKEKNAGKPWHSVAVETADAVLTVFPQIKRYNIVLKKGNVKATDRNINAGNLRGTRRTLDGAIGDTHIGYGIMSRRGIARYDDVKSLVIGRDGMITRRTASRDKDLYIFAYGHDFTGALKDFYALTGENPLLPRYSLGNWWSRYREYTDTEYLSLMDKFRDKGIPFSVATIDMDWHIVDVPQGYGGSRMGGGTGWTGYTWNKKLFPDPEGFLKKLKDDGYRVTLNLHPADGCRAHEECYEAVADYMGADKSKHEQIIFDMTNPKFINAYFELMHTPHEKAGVDFWWIDWQQGKKTAVDNLDPLWLLNHYHTLDNAKDGKRPLILSRYAGVGSHRYQLGFSGDTYIGWKLFNFMPYFTSVSSNVGFTWWSHDIGGHHFGKKDGELYARWIQFGAFSPVMRLHGTKVAFINKDPFTYRPDIAETAKKYLRLRHELLPYLYTMNYLNHTEGLPLIRPMYYEYDRDEYYKKIYRNMYLFGTELLVAPITKKSSDVFNREVGSTEVFLPKGRWTDIFTGYVYHGGQVRLNRGTDNIPVLAREGAILVTTPKAETDTTNPKELTVRVFPGKDNAFTLYEDNGEDFEYKSGAYYKTETSLKGNAENFTVTIRRADADIDASGKKQSGDTSVIPKNRSYTILLNNVVKASLELTINGVKTDIETSATEDGRSTSVTVKNAGTKEIVLNVTAAESYKVDKEQAVFSAFDLLDIGFMKKRAVYKLYQKRGVVPRAIKGIVDEIGKIE
jgi:alpha-glucosidase (family GH31 glycosyl hydrolase)